jgi:hypothetical protein
VAENWDDEVEEEADADSAACEENIGKAEEEDDIEAAGARPSAGRRICSGEKELDVDEDDEEPGRRA